MTGLGAHDEAPPLYGEDEEEIATLEEAGKDEYIDVVKGRKEGRTGRENAEDNTGGSVS